jgi:hypothetical protein
MTPPNSTSSNSEALAGESRLRSGPAPQRTIIPIVSAAFKTDDKGNDDQQ